jgi:pimeloyl-ACP methyl ester carboxylesterase
MRARPASGCSTRNDRAPRWIAGFCVVAAAVVAGALSSCSLPKRAANPSFAVTRPDAAKDLARMQSSPVTATRPVVFLAGIGDPAVSSGALRKAIEPTLSAPADLPVGCAPVAEVHFFGETSFDGARQTAFRELALAFGVEPTQLPEVDVVAFSMGGLVARDLAIADKAGRRLPIRRLYTVGTPHQGARLAGVLMGIPIGADMMPSSEFLARLADAPRDYELVCYTRLDDVTVGEEYTAPNGEPVWWLPSSSGEWGHMSSFKDPRFQADIARRLRGEEPLTHAPAAPLPN